MSMKNSSETIGNRTCDLPTCRAVPQEESLSTEYFEMSNSDIINYKRKMTGQREK
jgi:hypothetical protein